MATLWNSGDKSLTVTLSGGSLTATTTSSAQAGVRATGSVSGQVYIEGQIAVGASAWYFGFANSASSLAAIAGSNTNGVSARPLGAVAVFFNGALTFGSNIGGPPSVCGLALDVPGKLFWSRLDGGYWNGDPLADPATGTGGVSLAAIAAGPYFPIFGANATGAQCVANFGAKSFFYAPPSGFVGMDTNVQAYDAASKFVGYDLLTPPGGAASASKFVGYDILDTPVTAAVASKFLAYAVLRTSAGGSDDDVQVQLLF